MLNTTFYHYVFSSKKHSFDEKVWGFYSENAILSWQNHGDFIAITIGFHQ